MPAFTLTNPKSFDMLTSLGKIPAQGTLGADYIPDDVSVAIAAGNLTVSPVRLTVSSDLTAVAITYSGGGTAADTVPAITADATVLVGFATGFRELGRLRADAIRITNDLLNLSARVAAAEQRNA